MRIRVVGISPVENRKFGKKRELQLGQARLNTLRVRIWSKEEAEAATLADVTAPPGEGTIEVLWGDHATLERYRQFVRNHPDHELIEEGDR